MHSMICDGKHCAQDRKLSQAQARRYSDIEEIEIFENPELEFINVPKLQSGHQVDINSNLQLKVAKVGSGIGAGTVIGRSVVVNSNPELSSGSIWRG